MFIRILTVFLVIWVLNVHRHTDEAYAEDSTIHFDATSTSIGIQIDTDSKNPETTEPEEPKHLTLTRAVMCEGIKELDPINPCVVFSISIGKAFCYTTFNPVPEKTFIFHNWYRIDRLSTKIRLTLNIPSWSTYSSIQLREADIGPWRVEVVDEKGNILKILRFSITE